MPTDLALGFPKSNLSNRRACFGKNRNVELLYPSDDLAPFLNASPAPRIRKEFGMAGNAPIAAIIGRLQRWKGQGVFLRAAAEVATRLPEARFLVVGGTSMPEDMQYEKELHSLTTELGLNGKVVFTGHQKDVHELMSASDVIVHTSIDPEPFGLVIIEGMAAGKPVIATAAGGPAEVVLEGETGYLTPIGDAHTLADRMLTLLSSPGLRTQIGAAGRKRVIDLFSNDTMVRRLETYLKRVMA